MEALVGGHPLRALVDTGCTASFLSSAVVSRLQLRTRSCRNTIHMLDGATSNCNEVVWVRVAVGAQVVPVKCIVGKNLVAGCDAILGLDVINALGGVTVKGEHVEFANGENEECVCAGLEGETGSEEIVTVSDSERSDKEGGSNIKESKLRIAERDFEAVFDGEVWMVKWKWKDGEPVLQNQKGEYAVRDEDREEYEAEVANWIREGWLQEHDPQVHGVVNGVIPLMAVAQPHKQKVRPVMDYRELNQHVFSFPGRDAAVCADELREWRKMGDDVCMLDLRKAYLQLHVSEELVRFQAVRYKGKVYVMTRMGFGLNAAPKVMSSVLRKVLSLNDKVSAGTASYIDDIIVNNQVVSPDAVRAHLLQYGLVTKDPVSLNDARVLGLRVQSCPSGANENESVWGRDGVVPDCDKHVLTKRELFSLCGQLVGHYPVAGWLRVVCSYIKRAAGSGGWDELVSSDVVKVLAEVINRVKVDDPVRGKWSVTQSRKGRVWCDASSLALGVCVEIDGNVVEDGTWLRKKGEIAHINVAELEASIKGLNLALKWGLREVEIMCDSVTACGWLRSVVADTHRPRVSGLSEMVVKRRLAIVAELIEVYGLVLDITLVPTERNCADTLTRVSKRWQLRGSSVAACTATTSPESITDMEPDREAVKKLHDMHHLGVARTTHFVKMRYGDDANCEALVKDVVGECSQCRRIDPAAVRWEHGTLEVDEPWERIAVDLVHAQGHVYLSLVDCGPGRFTIWRRLSGESSEAVSTQLHSIFRERGAPRELLTDGGPCFRGAAIWAVTEKWSMAHLHSCAYRPTGNSIVERNHRTIKRMAARTGNSVEEMVVFYNHSPNAQGVVPANTIYTYLSKNLPGVGVMADQQRDTADNPYRIGDSVYVRPPGARCTTTWPVATVQEILSNTAVKIGGVPRHVRDIRLAGRQLGPSESGEVERNGNGVEDSLFDMDLDLCFGNDNDDDDGSNGVNDSDGNGAASDDDGEASSQVGSVRSRQPPAWLADYYTD